MNKWQEQWCSHWNVILNFLLLSIWFKNKRAFLSFTHNLGKTSATLPTLQRGVNRGRVAWQKEPRSGGSGALAFFFLCSFWNLQPWPLTKSGFQFVFPFVSERGCPKDLIIKIYFSKLAYYQELANKNGEIWHFNDLLTSVSKNCFPWIGLWIQKKKKELVVLKSYFCWSRRSSELCFFLDSSDTVFFRNVCFKSSPLPCPNKISVWS